MTIRGSVGKKPCGFGIGLRFLVVTLVLGSAGSVHGGPEIAGQGTEAVGQYLLVSANGQELPAVVSASGARRQEVIGGSIRFEADSSFVWSTRYRYTERGVVDVSESSGSGTYSQQGTRIVPQFEVGADGCCDGTLDGDTLTIQADAAMVYRKISGQRPIQAVTVPDRGDGPPPPPGLPPDGFTFSVPLARGDRTDNVSFILPRVRRDLPGSFEELCDSSILIAEAYVQSVLAPRQGVRDLSGIAVRPAGSFPIFRFLETDSILQVRQVFKGPESIRGLVVSQKGGVLGSYTELPTQYSLMQQGEHYILFLTEEARTGLPDVTGIPRYGLNGGWTGVFQIDEGGVHVSPDTADVIREQIDGSSSEEVIAQIQRCS